MKQIRMSKKLLMCLAILILTSCSQAESTSLPGTISVTPPSDIIPLEGMVYVSVEELGGHLTLKLKTEKIYGCCNNKIDTRLDVSEEQTISIVIGGIVPRAICKTAEGPARSDVELGLISGEYDLVFQYAHQIQEYSLIVSSTDVIFIPKNQNSFLESKYPEWKRLPENSMWFVLHNEGVHKGGRNWQPLERSVYEQLSAEFFRDIEQFDAKQFLPIEGHYTNYLFVPLWEGWHGIVEDRVKIPLETEGWYEFRWPYIRYYIYGGEWRSINELVETYREYGLGVSFFNISGYPYVP